MIGSAHMESTMGEHAQRAVSAEDTDASSHLRSAAAAALRMYVLRAVQYYSVYSVQILRSELLGSDYSNTHAFTIDRSPRWRTRT